MKITVGHKEDRPVTIVSLVVTGGRDELGQLVECIQDAIQDGTGMGAMFDEDGPVPFTIRCEEEAA